MTELEKVTKGAKRKNNLDYIYTDSSGCRTGLQVVCDQQYENCTFSGVVTDHDVDTVGLVATGDGKAEIVLLLRPDEAAAVIHVLSGALWAHQVDRLIDADVLEEMKEERDD